MRTYEQIKTETYFNSGVRHSNQLTFPGAAVAKEFGIEQVIFSATDQLNNKNRTDNNYYIQFPYDFELFGMYFVRTRVYTTGVLMKSPEANDSVLVCNSAMLCSLQSDNYGEICKDIDLGSMFSRLTRDMHYTSYIGPGKISIGMEIYTNSGNFRGIVGGIGAPSLTPDPVNISPTQFVNAEGRGIIFREKEVLKLTTTKKRINPLLIQTDITSYRSCILVGRVLN